MIATLDWLGCATFRLTLGNVVLFLDAYLDRVPSAEPVDRLERPAQAVPDISREPGTEKCVAVRSPSGRGLERRPRPPPSSAAAPIR